MNIDYLSQLMSNRLAALLLAKDQAFQSGDLDRINAIDAETREVENTLSQLKLISGVTAAAVATNTTAAEIIATGLDAVQTNSIQGPSAGAIVNGYDISAYATDPLHEQKIQNLILGMPVFDSTQAIDTYIQSSAPGSFVTGTMVETAAKQYAVDLMLMLAIMQNDSNFGMLGVGARTNNPGNVGNNGVEERSYASWDDGVLAVAEWLSRHRYVPQETIVAPPVVEEEEKAPEKPARKKKVVEEETPEKPAEEPPVVEDPAPEPEPLPEEPTPPPTQEDPVPDTASTTPPTAEPEATTTPSEVTP